MKARKAAPRAGVKSQTSRSGHQDTGSAFPSLEEIRLRAYEIYIERRRSDGQDLEDWFQAENELTENHRKRQSG
jgi:hypothetical protein